MKNRDKLISIGIIIIFFYVVANLGSINSFLTFATDKTYNVGDSQIVVPEAWNLTSEVNMTDKAKTNDSITNQYVIWNVWEKWPENRITEISTEKFRAMEKGGYEVLNESTVTLAGINVSKQYFYNPSRDTDTIWDCIGVNYVFKHEDVNYAVQIHYFTKIDYNNQTYLKEVDDRMEDFITNIHNKQYDGFLTPLGKMVDYIRGYLHI